MKTCEISSRELNSEEMQGRKYIYMFTHSVGDLEGRFSVITESAHAASGGHLCSFKAKEMYM